MPRKPWNPQPDPDVPLRRADGDDSFIDLTLPTGNKHLPSEVSASWPQMSDSLVLTPAPFVPPPDNPADSRGLLAKFGRGLILALPILLITSGIIAYVALGLTTDPPPAPKGKLVVLLAFDFLPGDKVGAWGSLFGTDGFERMKAEGVWYPHVEIPQAFTAAAPGFANLVTGRPPNGHGVTSDSPADPLAPTVGDLLKSTGRGKVVAVGLDGRVRALAGKSADIVVGFDSSAGIFRSLDRPDPGWLGTLNGRHPADRWHGTNWDRLRPTALYDALIGLDSPAGKTIGANQATSFPHPFRTGPAYNLAVTASPAGNDLTWEAAKAAIDGEQLGQRGDTDLLLIGLTAGGTVMRNWGPEGHEAADTLARADALVAELLMVLNTTVGSNRWSVVVAGCHGGCPLPEAAKPGQPTGERFVPTTEYGQLSEAMDATYGKVGGQVGQWVERVEYPWVYLNHKTLAGRKLAAADAAAYAAQWLGNRTATLAAFPRTGPFPDDPIGRAVAATIHPTQGGDIFLVTRPYAVPAPLGSAAGSPHLYDRSVTLLALGNGVPPLKAQSDRLPQTATAAILAKLLGIDSPSDAMGAPRAFE